MLQIFIEVISEAWYLILLLFILGWVMQWVIRRTALMCQSVYVVFVPWGILWVVTFTYLAGFLEYKQVILLALVFLAAYPGIWYGNYKFTQQLSEILKKKHVTHETENISIWPEETRWIWLLKRQWRKRRKLDEETIDWILDYSGRNGFSSRYGIPVKDSSRDN